MMTKVCLVVVTLLVCLQYASGRWNGHGRRKPQVPSPNLESQTIDQVLVQSSGGGGNLVRGRRMEDGSFNDGFDIKLSKKQYKALFGKDTGRSYSDENPIFHPWPQGIIPYAFVPYHFSYERQARIQEAMAEWESLTCIRFRPRRYGDNNYINFFSGQGCYSELSMKEDPIPQELSLNNDGCFWRGTVEHELGHAIGLVHEHQRPERDNFVGVNEMYIQPYFLSQLRKYSPKNVNKMGLPYDYLSVMHYGQHAFAYDQRFQTLFAYDRVNGQRRPDITDKLGRVMGPSFLDVKLVNMMYDCSANCTNPPTCRPDCFVDQNCECFCKEDMPHVPCADHLHDCREQARKGACHTNAKIMMEFCRKTCGVCAVGDSRLPPSVGKPLVEEECRDNDRRCPEWARLGDCRANPEYMLNSCRKSCKECQPVGGKPEPEPTTTEHSLPCRDDNDSCEGWAAYNQCEVNPGYMLIHCRKSCSKC